MHVLISILFSGQKKKRKKCGDKVEKQMEGQCLKAEF